MWRQHMSPILAGALVRETAKPDGPKWLVTMIVGGVAYCERYNEAGELDTMPVPVDELELVVEDTRRAAFHQGEQDAAVADQLALDAAYHEAFGENTTRDLAAAAAQAAAERQAAAEEAAKVDAALAAAAKAEAAK
jgi:hypothetical protein